jgi:hypothetical protein
MCTEAYAQHAPHQETNRAEVQSQTFLLELDVGGTANIQR